MLGLIEELYPICRSITGDGVRATLERIGAEIPLRVEEVPSGTEVFDWTVPREWNIRDAYVKNLAGERVIDFKRCNLHVLGYSVPVAKRVSRAELDEHLFSLPEHPDWIPYRTSYYQEAWGFCVSERQREALDDAEYDVVIDSSLEDGALTYGECLLEGETADEVLISCHVCHPSLCNDNLSGIALATALARSVRPMPGAGTRTGSCSSPGRSARSPGSPAIRQRTERIKHGLVLTCVGDAGRFDLQAQPARRRGDRPGDGPGAARLGPGPRDRGLQPLGLRRAPVLLARLRPAGGLSDAHPARPLSRVPHLGRRPRARAPRGARGLVRQVPAAVRRSGAEPHLPEHEPATASRSSESAGSTTRSGAERTESRRSWRCSGSSTSPTETNDLLEIAARASMPFETIARCRGHSPRSRPAGRGARLTGQPG